MKIYHATSKVNCHTCTEIVKNLWIGKFADWKEMVKQHRTNIIIPLNDLDAEIWNVGFRGRIIYVPIDDYGTLPKDVAIYYSKYIKKLINHNKVGMFCLGGHGRTGYMAALVLGWLGYTDPIGYLRDNYCKDTIESSAQINQIADILNKPELKEYEATSMDWASYYYGSNISLTPVEHSQCCDCSYYYPVGKSTTIAECLLDGEHVLFNDKPCKKFVGYEVVRDEF